MADAPTQRAYVGIGANLGDARATVAAALRALAALPGCQLTAASALYRSAPVDAAGPDFFNAVAALDTDLAPQSLLAALQHIEQTFGRQRPYPNAPRTLDLDLIDYHGRMEEGPPTLPHPRMAERAFVLVPLFDVAPDWRHPVTGHSIAELIAALPEESRATVVRLAPG